jgi:hypothetical protein
MITNHSDFAVTTLREPSAYSAETYQDLHTYQLNLDELDNMVSAMNKLTATQALLNSVNEQRILDVVLDSIGDRYEELLNHVKFQGSELQLTVWREEKTMGQEG